MAIKPPSNLRKTTMTVITQDIVRKPFVEAYNALKVLGVPVFTHQDHTELGNFGIDAEAEGADLWVSYFNARHDWIFGVHPALDRLLGDYDLFAEWVNPGCLGVYER